MITPSSQNRSTVKIGRKQALRARGLSGPDTRLRRMAEEIEGASGVGGRWVELLFDPEPRSVDQPVVIFHHIPKTGGTSLKRTVERNFPDGSVIVVAHPDLGPGKLRIWWEDLFNSMTEEENTTLRVVSSHTAGFAIDLPARAQGVTMVRDPVDQILSQWFFIGRRTRDSSNRNLDRLRAIYEGRPRKKDATAHRKDRFLFYWFNPQARTLLAPHFDLSGLDYSAGPPPDADLWRARLFSLLSRRFLVGVQDRFDDSVQRFTEELGWTPRSDLKAPAAKVNAHRPHPCRLDEQLANMIRSANWLDVELYTRYSLALGGGAGGSDAQPGRRAPRGPGYVVETCVSGEGESAPPAGSRAGAAGQDSIR